MKLITNHELLERSESELSALFPATRERSCARAIRARCAPALRTPSGKTSAWRARRACAHVRRKSTGTGPREPRSCSALPAFAEAIKEVTNLQEGSLGTWSRIRKKRRAESPIADLQGSWRKRYGAPVV